MFFGKRVQPVTQKRGWCCKVLPTAMPWAVGGAALVLFAPGTPLKFVLPVPEDGRGPEKAGAQSWGWGWAGLLLFWG